MTTHDLPASADPIAPAANAPLAVPLLRFLHAALWLPLLLGAANFGMLLTTVWVANDRRASPGDVIGWDTRAPASAELDAWAMTTLAVVLGSLLARALLRALSARLRRRAAASAGLHGAPPR